MSSLFSKDAIRNVFDPFGKKTKAREKTKQKRLELEKSAQAQQFKSLQRENVLLGRNNALLRGQSGTPSTLLGGS